MGVSRQFGGGIMGGQSLQAGTDNVQNFRNIPQGPIGAFFVKLAFAIKSSGAAFQLVVDTGNSAAGEGVDDIDLLEAAMYSALVLQWDQFTQAFNFTFPQLRSILGFLNLKDVLSTLANGTSCPSSGSSALAANVTLVIPVTLERLIADGNMFSNGSARLQFGSMDYKAGSSLTPSVVLANGTAVVSAMTTDIKTTAGAGDMGDVGPVWQATNPSGVQTVYQFGAGRPYLAIMDRLAVASNPATGISIGPFEQFDPTIFGQMYEEIRIAASNGYDVTARLTPYLWPTPGTKFEDMVTRFGQGAPRLSISGGVSDVDLYVIQVVEPSEAVVGQVSTEVTGGGPVGQTPITPSTRPPGSPVLAAHSPFLPFRIQPRAAAPAAAVHSANPTAAAQKQSRSNGAKVSLLSLAGARRR